MRTMLARLAAAAIVACVPATLAAQGPPDFEKLMAAQRAAMERLAFLDGTWRGTAWSLSHTGEKHTLTQTERVGSFLGGAVRVIEGRGYDERGEVAFNAFAVLSYDVRRKAYTMRSYAMGFMGDYPVTVRPDGFTWEIQQGPNVRTVYTATITGDTWHEIGERFVAGREPVRSLEMTLKRIGSTTWPAEGSVPPQ